MPDPKGDLEAQVREALAEMESAMRAFEDAYTAWATSEKLDAPARRGLLSQAEARLAAAREALEALETALESAGKRAGS